MAKRNQEWQKIEDYISERLKAIDPYTRPTKASGGNTGESHDIKTNCGLAVECKQRSTESITVKSDVWKKLNAEIPLHCHQIPVLALENKNKQRWAVLDLDDFLNLFIEVTKYREGDL